MRDQACTLVLYFAMPTMLGFLGLGMADNFLYNENRRIAASDAINNAADVKEAVELIVNFQSHNLDPIGCYLPIADKVGHKALLSINAQPGCENFRRCIKSQTNIGIQSNPLLD